MAITTIIQTLIKITEHKFNNKIDALAQDFYKSTIVPFCDKYNLNYVSGNGDYFFFSEEHSIYFHDVEVDELLAVNLEDAANLDEDDIYPIEEFALKYPNAGKEMKEIYEILDIPVSTHNFGHRV